MCASSAAEASNQRTAVIVVLSARSNFVHRNLVRQTYGSIKTANDVRILAVVFLLGNLDQNEAEQDDAEKLEEEIDQFGDIIMGDFIDSYRNLTLKTVMGYQWLTSHCREAQFVVKTDDDVFVNIFKLTEEIDSLSPADVISSKIWGAIHFDENTVTDVLNRFYASPIDFPNGKFPEHCAGIGYLTVIGVIDRIVDEISKSFTGDLCTHEDVFITGIVPKRINSIQSSNRRRNPTPIQRVNRMDEWIDFTFENGGNDYDNFLSDFIFEADNENQTENFKIFRKRHGTKIFYLFTHTSTEDFRNKYLGLWEIIKENFAQSVNGN